MMKTRYERNIGTITEDEQELLSRKAVCVVGCGGLGGGVIEELTRMGIGKLTVVDCDVFEDSNLNRQVLSNEDNLGHSKAIEARIQMKNINSDVQVNSVQARFDSENGCDIVRGHDVVVDALDSIESRLVLEDVCEAEGIPLVHGAIGGWCGEVAVIMPGDRFLHEIYSEQVNENALGERPTNPAFTPAVVAAIEMAETLKILLEYEEVLTGKILTIDLFNHEYETIDFQ